MAYINLKNKGLMLLFLAIIGLSACVQPTNQGNELTVYTYDSLVSDFGWGKHLIEGFENECDCTVNMLSMGDTGQVLTRLILEKENPKADVVIGIDNTFYFKAKESNVLDSFTPTNADIIDGEFDFDKSNILTTYDYGFIAFNYDSELVLNPPNSFESLTNPLYKDRILIQNPRTSSPGLALLFWTISVYGEDGFEDYWKRLKPNILTVTSSWDESFGLFQAGEAPIMLGYGASAVYHAEFEDSTRYKAALFSEGHFMQLEGVGIVKGTTKHSLAEKFIEYIISKNAQDSLPLTQFMYPINSNAILPDSFSHAVNPDKKLTLDPKLIAEKQEEWIKTWETIMTS